MKTIYVCTEGCYSDYHICGVFDNRELAEKFAETFDCGIEEWPVNPFRKELGEGYKPYLVLMDRDGQAEVRQEADTYSLDRLGTPSFGASDWMWLHCMAKSEEHAVKIANEHRTRLIALGQWGRAAYCKK